MNDSPQRGLTDELTRQLHAQVEALIAQKAKDAGLSRVVFDRAGYRYHGRVKAVADGAREGGLEF